MNLTTEQQRAIDNGQPIELVIDGRRCVLLPWELYEQFSEPALPPATLIRDTMAEDDEHDPLLDSYQMLKKKP